jgi:hypothetical protein
MDTVSLSQGDKQIGIGTHRDKIRMSAYQNTPSAFAQCELTFDQLYALINKIAEEESK